MIVPPALFVCLFLASVGLFFIGIAALWWVALQAKALKEQPKRHRPGFGRAPNA